MKIKHLLLILLIILANIYFIPIYKQGYKIGTWDPKLLNNTFDDAYVGLFMCYLIILGVLLLASIVYFDVELNGFKKISKLLNKKVL